MNYEEMLKQQDGVAQHKEVLPLGTFYKKLIDGKYRNVVELKPELADSLVFCDGLRHDQQLAAGLKSPYQLRYELHEDSGGIYEMELQPGNYQTLAQLLESNPAIVAERGFVDNFISNLIDITEQLHEKGVYHLCYAPQTIFVRKGERSPLLLCHGSSFKAMKDWNKMYVGYEECVAPETLAGEDVDERADVYALGRLIETIFSSGSIPYEYKGLVKKATQEEPMKRYSSLSEMRSAMSAKKNTKRSLFLLLAACLVVGLAVWAYFDLIPESSNVEFIDSTGAKPASDPFAETYDDPLVNDQDEYMDPEIAMYLDSIGLEEMTEEEVRQLSDSINTRNELLKIFRRRFTQKANTSIDKLYSNDQMGSSESDFLAHSGEVMSELMEYAKQLSEDTGLPLEEAQQVASQIISHLQAEKQQNVTHFGTMTQSGEDSE
jgi:serine/threonine protein kinase